MKEAPKTLAERREEFLMDTVNYYSANPAERRCINEDGSCCYAPVGDSKSEGCAIGRHLPRALAKKLDANYMGTVWRINTWNMLPRELQSLGQEFLRDIQNLHDNALSWYDQNLAGCIKDIRSKHILPLTNH